MTWSRQQRHKARGHAKVIGGPGGLRIVNEAEDEGMPAHLLDDAETLQCNRCGRRSVAVSAGDACRMTQPDRSQCPGTFWPAPERPIGDPSDLIR